MVIAFNGLGPNDSVTLNNKIYINGSVVETDNETGQAFIDAKIAFEVKENNDMKKVDDLRKLEKRNEERRKKV